MQQSPTHHQKITPYIDTNLNLQDEDVRILYDHVKTKDPETYPRGPQLFDEYVERKRANKVARGELPQYKYRARNQFRSRMPSAMSLEQKRRSFKAKRGLSRNEARDALASSLERDPSGDLPYVSDRSRSRSRSRRRSPTSASTSQRPKRREYELAFGSSQVREANFALSKPAEKTRQKYGLSSASATTAHKPVKNQTLRTFLKTCDQLYQKGEFERCKKKTEDALKEYDGEKEPVSGQLYVLCAKANFKLGYLIFAESLLQKCFKYKHQPDVIFDAHWLLGQVYRNQG